MVELSVPELVFQDGDLEPIARRTKGLTGPLPDGKLDRWVALGIPVTQPITETLVAGDPALVQYLKDNTGERFFLVHLASSFRPSEDEPFTGAWVKIELAADGADASAVGSGAAVPIAWSMDPQRLEKTTQVTNSVKLGAALKLTPAVELSPSLEDSQTTSVTQSLLIALNEQRADPAWEFRRTDGAEILGNYRLSLVVRTPPGVAVRGSVALEGTVQRKHLGIFPYRALFEDRPKVEFTLA